METRFYGRIASAEIIPPSQPDLDDVHEAYVSMAASGRLTEKQRSIFYDASHRLLENHGVEAIMLGGTDLALAFAEDTTEFRLRGHSCRCNCAVCDYLMIRARVLGRAARVLRR
jgi:aspartate racemase